jgi:hypothetical protein
VSAAHASHGLTDNRELAQIKRVEAYNTGWEFYFDNDVFMGSTSEVSFDWDQLEPLMLSGWLGVTKTFASGFGFSFVIQAQTSEIDLPGLKQTVWGGLVVSRIY